MASPNLIASKDQSATTIFLKKYLRQVLLCVGLLLMGVIVLAFLWGIATISMDIGQAVSPNSNVPTVTSFNLSGAANLNFKGLDKTAAQ